MKITFQGGAVSDTPMLGEGAYVLYCENLRWRNGLMETLDWSRRLPVGLGPRTAETTIFQDHSITAIADGKTVWFLEPDGSLTRKDLPGAADSGPWWFVSTDEHLIGARSNTQGTIYTFERAAPHAAAPLKNAPSGALGGGIVANILVLIGAESASGLPANRTVRWSARITDPVDTTNQSAGFESWRTRADSAAGEMQFDDELVGGGAWTQGMAVFTDSRLYALIPRTDLYVFNEQQIADRGLLNARTWVELDSQLWWYDQARQLCRSGGGVPDVVISPIERTTLNRLVHFDEMVALREWDEVVLLGTTGSGSKMQVVYNVRSGEWYPWTLCRVAFADRYGALEALDVDVDGTIYSHDVRMIYDPAHYRIQAATQLRIAPPNFTVEPQSFYMCTNIIGRENPVRQGLKNTNLRLSHAFMGDPEEIDVSLLSYDTPAPDAPLIHADTKKIMLGSEGADFRGGGKGMRLVMQGTNVSAHVTFGYAFVDLMEGSRR